MAKILVALAVIAAGAIAENSPEVPVGETFEAADAVASYLIETSQAKLFVEVPKEKLVKARVLVDCEHGKAGDVAKLPTTVAQAAQNAGMVDTHASAVAYAERQIRLAQQAAEDNAA